MSNDRLPTQVEPIHYDLVLRTDLEEKAYYGVVFITLSAREDTSTVTLHVADPMRLGQVCALIDDVAGLKPLDGYALHTIPARTTIDAELQRATFEFPVPFTRGTRFTLRVHYRGNLTDTGIGYSLSEWKQEGEPRVRRYAKTMFQPIRARSAVPCFDEPALKATFAVSMITRVAYTNLNNMPAIEEAPYDIIKDAYGLFPEPIDAQDAWKITRFDKTPRMCTYLLAFTTGEFAHLDAAYTSPITGERKAVRVNATPNIVRGGKFILDVISRTLPLYEKLFDVAYPLPKLDTLLATSYGGGMENWGLIVTADDTSLVDPDVSDPAKQRQVLSHIAHEVAHNWFGNIVTMDWWSCLYLNEGLTSMFTTVISDQLFPEWDASSAQMGSFKDGLELDCKPSSHPVEVDVSGSTRLNAIFDKLTYSKSESLFGMIMHFLGQETFVRGIRLYLKRHLYSNTVRQDLWAALSEASGLDVEGFADPWFTQIGFPLLTVSELPGGLLVRQDRLLDTGIAQKDDNTLWQVPLIMWHVTPGGSTYSVKKILLKDRETVIPCDLHFPYKLNYGNHGFYRVLYTGSATRRVADVLLSVHTAPTRDRIGFVNDATALTKAGLMKVGDMLDLFELFIKSTVARQHLVLEAVAAGLSVVASTWWEDGVVLGRLRAWERTTWRPIFDDLGFEHRTSDSVDVRAVRALVITRLAAAGDVGVVSELQRRFRAFIDGGDDSGLTADLEQVVMSTGVKYGGAAAYDEVRALYTVGQGPFARKMYIVINALSATEDPARLDRVTVLALDEARSEHVPRFLGSLSANPMTRRRMVEGLLKRFDGMVERFKDGMALELVIQDGFSGLSSTTDYETLKNFFEARDTTVYQMVANQTLDAVRANMLFLERATEDLKDWLQARCA
ncbi:peptidase family M1-domain-containing protein [Schizophyllum amplum]|uniref:Aminopeptidase n=1 Tax=Schizophyllum amplum TaxID=97359 RepID=A0A550CF91_9AGAR|nr:peptidase family M1-domain-containing protein [Auriculariopsis ampla]